MRLLTVAQAAALAVLTIFGAHAASKSYARSAADPSCLSLSEARCGLPGEAPHPLPEGLRP